MFSRVTKLLIVVVCFWGLVSCGGRSGPRLSRYNGPEVTWVVVEKERRRMYLFHNNEVLKEYKISLGFAPAGPKRFEGDGKTPEGTYYIDRQNPNSDFYLSLGISYPNAQDVSFARSYGRTPGGNIFIHGQPNQQARKRNKRKDWTAGCVAVSDREMMEIFTMVQPGTPITINP